MALPKFNDVPKYKMVVPSTNEEITFRPFLVKEQKILLLALESKDNKLVLQAVVDTLKACVDEKIDFEALTTFDIEFMFTMIRAKSAGEKADISLKCGKCEEPNTVTIILSDLKVKFYDTPKKFNISDDYIIEMKYPNYKTFSAITDEKNNVADNMLALAISCLDKLITEEEVIMFKDEKYEEIESFLESLLPEQFGKIMGFVTTLPSLDHHVEFDCEHCKEKNELTLKGLQDFF